VKAKAKGIYAKLKKVESLSEKERLMFATTLAETPDERWERSRTYLRLMDSCVPYKSTKSGS
jgi:hypothetical protein